MLSRRKLLKQISSVPLVGSIIGGTTLTASAGAASQIMRRDYFKELGVRTFINAAGRGLAVYPICFQ